MIIKKIILVFSLIIFLILINNISQDVLKDLNIKKETSEITSKIEEKQKTIKTLKSVIKKQTVKLPIKTKEAIREHFLLDYYDVAGFRVDEIRFVGKEIKKKDYSLVSADILFSYKTRFTLLRFIGLLHASAYVDKIVGIDKINDHQGIVKVVFISPTKI